MKNPSPSIPACTVILLSCLSWIGLLTFALFHFLDLSPLAGWIIAGVMSLSAIFAAGAILYEIRHAIDLKHYLDPIDRAGLLYWKNRKSVRPMAIHR